MPVVSLVLELRLAGCETTRQRRAQSETILKKMRNHFNVAVADLGRDDLNAPAVLGFSSVGRTRREARELLDRVADAVAAHPAAEILKAVFDDC